MANNETQDLQGCIDIAKEYLVDNLDGGLNYLRRHGADETASDLIHECADGNVPIYTGELIDVFRSSMELWNEAPDCGFEGDNGIVGAISRVIYDAISSALREYANELEGDPIMCEEDGCDEEDDHDEPADEEPRCMTHCDGAGSCEECTEEAELADGDDCGSCGASIGPSDIYPWHDADEDCRAVHEPEPDDCSTCGKSPETFVDGDCFDCNPPVSVEGRIIHAECGCPIGKSHTCRRIDTGQRGMFPYSVGLALGPVLRRFATELEASTFIGTLPGHADGRYFLDGPPDDGEPN